MRIYSAESQEVLRARDLLKDWAGEGFLTEAQYRQMEQEAVCDLRRTNIFLRPVLFLFSLLIVGAAAALFFVLSSSMHGEGVVLLIFAGTCYWAAEFAVSHFQLYRFGIEEALAACSVGFLCAELQTVFDETTALVPAAGAILSLWIWRRFGLSYAFLAAMIFVLFLPGYWTSSHPAQHVFVAVFYAIGLGGVAAARARHRSDYLNDEYSLVEALLWLGIYLAMNLQLSPVNLLGRWWGAASVDNEFSRPFYWATWVLTWCLPPVVLARGLRQKDRAVIAVGAIVAILTFATNKPYLGWQRNTWDPMLLGALLIGVALLIRRWLADGLGEIRHGFTARRLSGRDKSWMDAGATAIALASPGMIMPRPQAGDSGVPFGGGTSGGGGASSDY